MCRVELDVVLSCGVFFLAVALCAVLCGAGGWVCCVGGGGVCAFFDFFSQQPGATHNAAIASIAIGILALMPMCGQPPLLSSAISARSSRLCPAGSRHRSRRHVAEAPGTPSG